MQGLTLFSRTMPQRRWLIASWHSPHSLTWRWFVDFYLFDRGHRRAWPLGWKYGRPNGNLSCGFVVPWVGAFSLQTQKPMWFRNLYMRLRDEQDQREGMLWLNDRHPHKIHETPPPSATSVFDAPSTLQ